MIMLAHISMQALYEELYSMSSASNMCATQHEATNYTGGIHAQRSGLRPESTLFAVVISPLKGGTASTAHG
jgi:hypothetical protein